MTNINVSQMAENERMSLAMSIFMERTEKYLERFEMSPSALTFMAGGGAIGAFIVFYMHTIKRKTIAGKEHGTAEWATAKKIAHLTAKGVRKMLNDEIMKNKSLTKAQKKAKCEANNKLVTDSTDMILSQTERVSFYNREINNNTLVIGGSGSGKTRGIVLPSILTNAGLDGDKGVCSFCITDPKGEILSKCGQFLVEKGYKIRAINLFETENSDCYNPFAYLYRDRADFEESVLTLIDTIIKNTDGGQERQGNDPFWNKAEKQFLQALFFLTALAFEEKDRNMITVMKLIAMLELSEERDTRSSPLDMLFLRFDYKYDSDMRRKKYTAEKEVQENIILNEYVAAVAKGDYSRSQYEAFAKNSNGNFVTTKITVKERQNIDGGAVLIGDIEIITETPVEHYNPNIAVVQFNEFRSKAAGKTAKTIVMCAIARLAPYSTKGVQRISAKDTMHLERVGEELTAVFFIVPPTNDTLNFIAGMACTQLFQELNYCALVKHRKDGERLPVPVRFILDEFANTFSVPNFVKILAYARSLGICIMPILQSLQQIKTNYEKEWQTIVDNCNTIVYLGAVRSTDTLEEVSKWIGEGTFEEKDVSVSKGGQGSTTTSYKKIGRKLQDISEIQKLKKSKCYVLIGGYDAFMSNKYNYKGHKNYKYTSDADKSRVFIYHGGQEEVKAEEVTTENVKQTAIETLHGAKQKAVNEVFSSAKPETATAKVENEISYKAVTLTASETEAVRDKLKYPEEQETFVDKTEITAKSVDVVNTKETLNELETKSQISNFSLWFKPDTETEEIEDDIVVGEEIAVEEQEKEILHGAKNDVEDVSVPVPSADTTEDIKPQSIHVENVELVPKNLTQIEREKDVKMEIRPEDFEDDFDFDEIENAELDDLVALSAGIEDIQAQQAMFAD